MLFATGKYREYRPKGPLRLKSTKPIIIFHSETSPKSQEQVPKSVENIWQKFLTLLSLVNSSKTFRETTSKGEGIGEHNRNNTTRA